MVDGYQKPTCICSPRPAGGPGTGRAPPAQAQEGGAAVQGRVRVPRRRQLRRLRLAVRGRRPTGAMDTGPDDFVVLDRRDRFARELAKLERRVLGKQSGRREKVDASFCRRTTGHAPLRVAKWVSSVCRRFTRPAGWHCARSRRGRRPRLPARQRPSSPVGPSTARRKAVLSRGSTL